MSNYLIHWGLKKGSQKEGHKYLDRFWKNGKWQYIYKKKPNSNGLKTKLSSLLNKDRKPEIKSRISNITSKYSVNRKSSNNSLKSAISNKIEKAHKYISKYLVNGKWRYIYKRSTASIGKNFASNFSKLKVSDLISNKKTPRDIIVKNRDKKLSGLMILPTPFKSGLSLLIGKARQMIADYLYEPPKVVYKPRTVDNGRTEELDKFLPLKDLNDKPPRMSEQDWDQMSVNPNYDPDDDDDGWENNCWACTTTYDLRERGYDVKAINDTNGESFTNMLKMYDEPLEYGGFTSDWEGPARYTYFEHLSNSKKIEAINNVLLNQGDGARGNLCVCWIENSYDTHPVSYGGHSIVYSVENGQVYIRDCQINKKLTLEDWMYDINDRGLSIGGPSYLRLDNATPNINVIDAIDNGQDMFDDYVNNTVFDDWDTEYDYKHRKPIWSKY